MRFVSRRAVGVSLAVLSISFSLAYVFCPKPELRTFTTYSTALFDDGQHLLRITLSEDERYRLYTPLNEVANEFLDATILYEDKDFYSNSGVDFLALARAFITTYIKKKRRVGGSTISMQVARLRWNIPSNTIGGKFKQILRAIQLSRHYTKSEILETYVNLAPYGRNIEGIGAASLIYFDKHPSELSLPEALTLAVIPQNPNKRNPTNSAGYKHLVVARSNLFDRWVIQKPADKVKASYLEMPLNIRSPEELPFIAPHFIHYVQNKYSRWDHGRIYTTLDSNLQATLENILSDYVKSRQSLGINNASALLLNHETMEIKAMVGSADFFSNELQGQVNGVLAKRSPGSTLKPFVYGLAMDEGLIHPMTLLKDSPRRYGGFTPENYDKQFLGPILATDALIQSRNVPAVDLQAQLTKKSFYSFLQDAGISGLKEEEFYGLALALGGGELTMMELVSLYASLANGGVLKKTSSVKDSKQIDSDKKLLSIESSYLVLDMLKENPPPDVLGLDTDYLEKNEVAWKTGTSWAFRDAWAIGVSGPYVIATWVGNFDGKGNASYIGRSAAGPLLFSILDAVFPAEGWKVSDLYNLNQLNIKKLKACSKTGDLFEKHCPSSVDAWFIPGVSPIKVSNIYRSIPIDPSTSLRACWHRPGETELRVFEFWPSDFLHIYNQAGISLKTPPRFSEDCSLGQRSSSGQVPVLTSPQSTIEYIIRSNAPESRQVIFSATVDPDVDDLFWFVSGKYEGSSERGELFIWPAHSGHHEVRVVDDSGRSASTTIKVTLVH